MVMEPVVEPDGRRWSARRLVGSSPDLEVGLFVNFAREHGAMFSMNDIVGLPTTVSGARRWVGWAPRGGSEPRILVAAFEDEAGEYECIGFAGLDRLSLDEDSAQWTGFFGVVPRMRNRGIASALWASALVIASAEVELGCARPAAEVHVWCSDANVGALSVAASVGMARSGHQHRLQLTRGAPERTYVRLSASTCHLRLDQACELVDVPLNEAGESERARLRESA